MKRILCLLTLLLLILTGCAQGGKGDSQLHTRTVLAMDTVMDLSVHGDEKTLDLAQERIQELETLLSVTAPDSEISQLNREGKASLSPDTAALLNRALELCQETEGALDISIYPVVRAWGFTTGEYRVLGEEERFKLLEKVDYSQITVTGSGKASVPAEMELDLGSVAKGYTGDQLVELLGENGITSALLNLGGNVQALGTKPDGSRWKIAVRAPEGEGYLGYLSIADQAVVTSGGYERYFEGEDGTLYWHIISPFTGAPARSGLISVTVVGEEGTRCDGLSTALFVMGEEKAVQFWQAHQDFDMILVTEDGRMLVTSGLTDWFEPDGETEYEMAVIEHD